jgi:hypothetical protein
VYIYLWMVVYSSEHFNSLQFTSVAEPYRYHRPIVFIYYDYVALHLDYTFLQSTSVAENYGQVDLDIYYYFIISIYVDVHISALPFLQNHYYGQYVQSTSLAEN